MGGVVDSTCSSTKPPTLEAFETKSVTSPSMSVSNSSTDRGRGSGGGAVSIVGVADCAVPVVATEVCDTEATLVPPDASTEVAMSSNLDVAASSLAKS